MENPAPQFTPQVPPKKSNTGLIIGIVVAVVLCCCCVAVIAGLTLLGPAVGNIFSSVNQGLKTPGEPETPALTEMPSMPIETSEPVAPPMSDGTSEPSMPGMPTLSADLVPQGGLGDDLLRANTWAQVALAAALADCNSPTAAETTIEVTQQPDSNGVWKEQWTVACGAGKTLPVDVTFTPSSGGGTDISVTVTK
jgi:hypothetical protein